MTQRSASLGSRQLCGIAVKAIRQCRMGQVVDAVRYGMNRAVAEYHVEAAGMGTAEFPRGKRCGDASPILRRLTGLDFSLARACA